MYLDIRKHTLTNHRSLSSKTNSSRTERIATSVVDTPPNMTAIISFLSGKKTYIVGALVFVAGGLQALGYVIPPQIFEILGGLGLWTLRASVAKLSA